MKKYFSLTELLVVVTLLAILLSLLQPSLSKIIEASNRIECAKKMNTVGTAFILSYEDQGGFFQIQAGHVDAFNLYLQPSVNPSTRLEYFNCPSTDFKSYASTGQFYKQGSFSYNEDLGNPPWIERRHIGEVSEPSTKWVLVDGGGFGAFETNSIKVSTSPHLGFQDAGKWYADCIRDQHDLKANILFMDLHVDQKMIVKSDYVHATID